MAHQDHNAIIDPVKHNLNYHCFLGYDFKTLNNTECITFGNKLETWKEAEQACISDKKCEGVMNYGCNHQNFAMCLKDEEILTSSENKSCIHMKFSISKLQITKLTSYQTIFQWVFNWNISCEYLIFSRSLWSNCVCRD